MAETKGSNYVWWALFTGSVISGFVITLCLDGFFGSTKTQETLTYGVRGCAPGLMRDLGFTVSGMPENVGLPRIDYIEDAISFAEVAHGNTHPGDDRDRRSVDLVASDNTETSWLMGANFSASGPVPGNKGCFQMLKDYAEFLDENDDDTERLEWWENADNKPMQLLMCIAATYPPASTCITHPHLRVSDEKTGATKYMGFQAGTRDDENDMNEVGEIHDNARLVGDAAITLEEYRATEDFIPCEQKTRKQCDESEQFYFAAKDAAQGDKVPFSECVASSVAEGSPYKIASVAYLVDKTDLTVNKALCRYAGEIADGTCEGAYVLKKFGHAGGDVGHTGYQFMGTTYADNALNANLEPKYNNDDEHEAEPAGTAADAGGEFWARVTHQDPYIRELRGVGRDDLLRPDIEYMSAFAIAAYTRVINDNVRYTPQTAAAAGGGEADRGAQLGHVDEATDLTEDQQDNRAALLAAIPGTCFSPGVSGSLLYSEGWGAAYFSLGILLVVAHLVWLAAAVMGESMEMIRFNAKRAMSFLGILVGLIGLYLLFFTYGSGQGGIIDDDELRHFAEAIASNGETTEALTTTFLQRLSHGQMNVFDSDSFTNTATIQAAEALHFVILAFAIVTPLYSTGSRSATEFTVFYKV